MLGSNITCQLRHSYDILGLYHSHPVAIEGIETRGGDILSPGIFREAVRSFKPEIVIHCAALANVDDCETNKDLARNLNVLGTRAVVEGIQGGDIKLIYISTDSVYDGQKGHFSETDPVAPLNYYGRSKYEGELEALRHPKTLILRTNIFGWNILEKEGLAEWILNRLTTGQRIQGFQNVRFSSIYTCELAKVLDRAIRKDLIGTYNCGSADSLSKYEFMLRLARRFQLDPSLVEPIEIENLRLKAKRGKDLSLDVGKLMQDLDGPLPTLAESIEAFYRDYSQGLPGRFYPGKSIKEYPQIDYIPYGRQSIDDDDIASVVAVLKSSHLTQGPKVGEFEEALCRLTGAKSAVAVNSGTSALHIACLAAGIKPGDEVITTSNTFVASANCILYCGAKPVFADIDPKTYNLSAESIAQKITDRTRGIIPVHFAGQSCDMEAIGKIKNEAEKKYGHKIYLIEDAAHAVGSFYKGTAAGSCAFSDMTVMSFHPVKQITSGEGGSVLTNEETLCRRMKRFRSHGITGHQDEFINPEMQETAVDVPPWYYEQIDLGYNYRMTDIQCALALSQLKKLPQFAKRRREIVNRYHRHLSNVGFITTPYESADCINNFHIYVLMIDFPALGISRPEMMCRLDEQGIRTQVHYIPVHTQPFFRRLLGTNWGDCPQAEKYYEKCLTIPLYPAMTDHDVERVVRSVLAITGERRKPL